MEPIVNPSDKNCSLKMTRSQLFQRSKVPANSPASKNRDSKSTPIITLPEAFEIEFHMEVVYFAKVELSDQSEDFNYIPLQSKSRISPKVKDIHEKLLRTPPNGGPVPREPPKPFHSKASNIILEDSEDSEEDSWDTTSSSSTSEDESEYYNNNFVPSQQTLPDRFPFVTTNYS